MDDYANYLASHSWQDKAEAAKKRAGYTCLLCMSPHRLEVHHRTYDRLGNEWPEDLVVLCATCHQRHHGRRRAGVHFPVQNQLTLPI